MKTTVEFDNAERGRLYIHTDKGRYFMDFQVDGGSVAFDEADTTDEPDQLVLDALNGMDFSSDVLESREHAAAMEEDDYFSEVCHGDEYAYYGVSRSEF